MENEPPAWVRETPHGVVPRPTPHVSPTCFEVPIEAGASGTPQPKMVVYQADGGLRQSRAERSQPASCTCEIQKTRRNEVRSRREPLCSCDTSSHLWFIRGFHPFYFCFIHLFAIFRYFSFGRGESRSSSHLWFIRVSPVLYKHLWALPWVVQNLQNGAWHASTHLKNEAKSEHRARQKGPEGHHSASQGIGPHSCAAACVAEAGKRAQKGKKN